MGANDGIVSIASLILGVGALFGAAAYGGSTPSPENSPGSVDASDNVYFRDMKHGLNPAARAAHGEAR